MARRKAATPEPKAIQLPLFGAEEAIRVADQLKPPATDATLRQANAWFGLYLSSLEYSGNTIEIYTTSVELLARCLGDELAIGRVRSGQLQRYLTWLSEREGEAPVKTLALRVTGIRKFFEVLGEQRILTGNPAADLYAPAGEVPLPDVLTPEEQERMRDLAWDLFQRPEKPDARPLLLLLLTLDLGLRRGELETLTRSQVLVAQPQVAIRIHHVGRRHRYKNRVLAVPPRFREVYRAFLQQYPSEDDRVFVSSRRTLHRVVERLGKHVGAAASVTPTVMRWSCALRWHQELPPEEVQQRLGLSPIGWQDALRVLQGLSGHLPPEADPEETAPPGP